MAIDLHVRPKAVNREANSVPLTYKTRADADADRDQQLRFLELLGAVPSALRRDECGAWYIRGRNGRAYSWGDGESWVAYIAAGTPRKWTSLKRRLGFCRLTQDGEDEGALRFGPILTREQGAILRQALGIAKRVVLSPERRAALISMQKRFVRGENATSDSKTAETPSEAPNTPWTVTEAFDATGSNVEDTALLEVPAKDRS